jgi:hypothetical protein
MPWDSPLSAVEKIVTACATVGDDRDQNDGELRLELLVVEMPLELQTHTGTDGSVVLVAAPPRQAAATTVMPVLHRLRLVIEAQR